MITFTLGDEVLDYDEQTLMSSEAILLEKITGRRIVDLVSAFEQGEIEARVTFFWLARRRAYGAEKAGKLSDLDFNIGDFRVKWDSDTGTAPDPSTTATTSGSVADTAEPPASPPSSKKTAATSARQRSTSGSNPGTSGKAASPTTSGKR